MSKFKVGDIVQYHHVRQGRVDYEGFVGVVVDLTYKSVVVRWITCHTLESPRDVNGNLGLGYWSCHDFNLVTLGTMETSDAPPDQKELE